MAATNATVIYRRMVWDDRDAIVREFDNTWGDWSSAAGTPASMELSRHFVMHYLEPATHATIAEQDGRFMGVLISRIAGMPVMFPEAGRELAAVDRWLEQDPHGADALRETLQWHALETDLEDEVHVNETTQAEIELFLVSGAARGHGVGGTLWRDAMSRFAASGVSRYYLHTDSSCDVSFYAHKGLDCLVSWRAADHPQYGDDMDDIFIYAGEVNA
ncbi:MULTISPECIES: GNAT family N-acetyltransferase [Bifidobacterium]|uniref:GNAT family N-acetyltransferase n=1 Tax=Bifidobacterium TaxID=1678 RepID=UPI001F0AD084|nr:MULTISPECIES: GNAT family N-acetyltransferase [Bifidobacterium]